MDISFMTNAGGANNWSLDECAQWAKAHDFDCVRLGDSGGAIDSEKILSEGPDEVLETLKKHDLYSQINTFSMFQTTIQAHCGWI